MNPKSMTRTNPLTVSMMAKDDEGTAENEDSNGDGKPSLYTWFVLFLLLCVRAIHYGQR